MNKKIKRAIIWAVIILLLLIALATGFPALKGGGNPSGSGAGGAQTQSGENSAAADGFEGASGAADTGGVSIDSADGSYNFDYVKIIVPKALRAEGRVYKERFSYWDPGGEDSYSGYFTATEIEDNPYRMYTIYYDTQSDPIIVGDTRYRYTIGVTHLARND